MENEPLVPNGTEPDDTNTDTDAREAYSSRHAGRSTAPSAAPRAKPRVRRPNTRSHI